MGSHFLRLNDSKTEFILHGTPNNINHVSGWSVSVGGAEILPSKDARNIGAYFDREMNMRSQISNTIRVCYSQLRSISRIKKYITRKATEKLCHAFITSRVDNLNSLLHKLPQYQLQKIQLILNDTARVICKLESSAHITHTLQTLHWLPVEEWIEYKILLLVLRTQVVECLTHHHPSMHICIIF
jgi:flagellar biosynthesis chaperone FliJ